MGSDDLFKKRKLKRTQATKKVAPDRFLIICEGTKTEPNYFNHFKNKIIQKHRDSVYIEIIGEGKNTESLIREATRLKNRANPDYSQVWCVFDKDDFSDEQFNAACQAAQNEGIQLAYSVESFELWYLLHFDYLQTAIHRDQYIAKLKMYLGSYGKNDPAIYDRLMLAGGQEKQAISYSMKLEEKTKDLPFAK
ncbi:RloB family protein [Sporosarcina jeotgali]|uniref:RloB family protein n=1 Tax=Sporosarcina jeotgali TaxID=3020056 RepID=A0ABZ0KTV0_9BACL|nr:RloB family protein [Sporosarcina sp. B2O-1]WOV83670.1 RloB family protein [Sporosarcina sp. B2O-1]